MVRAIPSPLRNRQNLTPVPKVCARQSTAGLAGDKNYRTNPGTGKASVLNTDTLAVSAIRMSMYPPRTSVPALYRTPEIDHQLLASKLAGSYETHCGPGVNLPFEPEMLLKTIDTPSQVPPPALPTDPPGPTVAKPLFPLARDPARQSSTVLNFPNPYGVIDFNQKVMIRFA